LLIFYESAVPTAEFARYGIALATDIRKTGRTNVFGIANACSTRLQTLW